MEFNPIKSVDGKTCRCPSSYQWKLADVSASDAGRTEDTVMHKNRIGQTVGIELSYRHKRFPPFSNCLIPNTLPYAIWTQWRAVT